MSDSIAPESREYAEEGVEDAELKSIDFVEIRHRLLRRVTEAVETALARLHAAARGKQVFHSEVDLRATRAVIDLLPLLISERSVGDFERQQSRFESFDIPLIPRCPICNEGPGAHWAEDCPKLEKPDKTPIL